VASPSESALPGPARAAAFFDVDGTLLHGDVVRYYVRLRTQELAPLVRALWTAAFALRVPYYLALDRWSRARFQHALYRNYRGLSPAELATRARVHCEKHLLPALFPRALERLREHQERGEPLVLVTGSLRAIVAPLAERLGAADLLAAELEEHAGRFTGELCGEPLAGRAKAAALAAWAARHGFDPRACHAYADSRDDLPMLESVGHAHVVNPGGALARRARAAGWEILNWGVS
jgi:HAD superfamily hydrolase (TIGR01490 family)